MNIVFLCPAVRKPVGGVKVIYQQVALLNELLPSGSVAQILHPNTFSFRDKWFDNGAPQRRAFFKPRWVKKLSFSSIAGVFDATQDCVVIPEVWVRKYGTQLLDAGIPYAIYVQNGYFMSKGEREDLNRAYAGARCVLTISDDASQCVAMAFPQAKTKVMRVHYSVKSDVFSPDASKENLITYMPRKLSDHSQKVLFFLHNHLPKHWRVQAIHGLNESGVAQLLSKSKVFLSFSHFEGCPLPPLEAALSGNKVVGYTGQGAREYWHPDIFTAVESGNVVEMAQRVVELIALWDTNDQREHMMPVIKALSNTYSRAQEREDMLAFLDCMLEGRNLGIQP